MDAAQWPQPQGIIGGETSRNSEKKKPRPQLKEQAALNCPRCKSTNTKFCYYNNYSLTQPRYFCKNCRRYWTQGGTLRNVPVGGSSRKNKRSSSSSSSSSSSINPRNPSFNGVPFRHNLNPQNPNSGGLSSLASAPVPDPGSAFMSSGFPMHELKSFGNRFGDLQNPVQDGSIAFEEPRVVDGFWSGMLYSSGGSW